MAKIYDGTIELAFNPGVHQYTANGVVVPSVTSVTAIIDKPALRAWAVRETVDHLRDAWEPDRPYSDFEIGTMLDEAKGASYRKSQKAMNIGTLAHNWIESYVKARMTKGLLPEMPEEQKVRNAVNSYLVWEKHVGHIKYIESERRVYSARFMYSGTVDLVAEINGKLVVADLKTSKAIYPEYLIQAAAYAWAIMEEDGIVIDDLMIIRIPKNGDDVEILSSDQIKYFFNVFRSCLVVWRWKNGWKNEQLIT